MCDIISITKQEFIELLNSDITTTYIMHSDVYFDVFRGNIVSLLVGEDILESIELGNSYLIITDSGIIEPCFNGLGSDSKVKYYVISDIDSAINKVISINSDKDEVLSLLSEVIESINS